MTNKFQKINGWSLLADIEFIDQLSKIQNEVAKLKAADPQNYGKKNAAKRLAVIEHFITVEIPRNPADPKFRLGTTLGPEHKNWFRAKFLSQYRLFYRFDSKSKIIIFAWINDESTLRAYESKTDAYLIFKRMLTSGRPPTNWTELLDGAVPISASTLEVRLSDSRASGKQNE